MRWQGFIATVALVLLAACSSEPTPDSVSRCVAANFPSYNAKEKEQCIAACIKCKNGVTTTCATACSLAGAR